MTFCATWVVDRIVVTHFLNPVVGLVSGHKSCGTEIAESESSAKSRTAELSNQNRQVI